MAFPWLKPVIPESLFGRFLLIIIIPTVLVQIVATYIFYERHWNSVSRHMTTGLAGDIAFITQMFWHSSANDRSHMLQIANKNLYLSITFEPGAELASGMEDFDEPESLSQLRKELNSLIPSAFTLHYINDEADIKTNIQLADGILHITSSTKRLENQTTYIFIYWMTGTAALLLVIAIIFSKNQLRAITRLARAAEMFGKGIETTSFKPEGAREVRQAATAFLEMKERIQRQVKNRTDMLSGVSHDLRTPLTRIKLQLALMPASDETKALHDDVIEMEKMIQEYLDFARGEGTETTKAIFIPDLITDITSAYQNRIQSLTVTIQTDISLPLRHQAMKRMLTNILENAVRYGSQIQIRAIVASQHLIIEIEDNGPGIPEDKYADVFKPFYRIDNSRNLQTGGVGLGLSIASDIIHSHGGSITLARSEALGGLKVIISLPV